MSNEPEDNSKDWDAGQQVGNQKEVMRKLKKITFIERGEEDTLAVEKVRLELDADLAKVIPSIESAGVSLEQEISEDFKIQQGAVADGGLERGWESFLPQRHLRVLLVEDDDSTRHVVGALLRNCNYEVTPASNGLLAWDYLQDCNHQFDIVLTDVIMPGMSGISLLSKIMTTDACKGIPVIMMSSHDSVDLVLKCFQKGAADFLLKPVRKNELKNLWQHVWRKCYSSSGSGSGSGSSGKVSQPKSRVGSGHESGNGSDDDAHGTGSGSSLNARGSDNGSGTQNNAEKKIQQTREDQGNGTSVEETGELAEAKVLLEMGPPRPRHAVQFEADVAVPHRPEGNDQGSNGTEETPDVSADMEAAPSTVEDRQQNTSTPDMDLDTTPEGNEERASQEEAEEAATEAMEDKMELKNDTSGNESNEEATGHGGRGSNNPDEEMQIQSVTELKRTGSGADAAECKLGNLRHAGPSAFSRYGTAQPIQQQSMPPSSSNNNYSVNQIPPHHCPLELHADAPLLPNAVAAPEASLHRPGHHQEEAPGPSGSVMMPPHAAMPMRVHPNMMSYDSMAPQYVNFGPPLAAYYDPRVPPGWGPPPRSHHNHGHGHMAVGAADREAAAAAYAESAVRLSRPHPHHHHHHQQQQQQQQQHVHHGHSVHHQGMQGVHLNVAAMDKGMAGDSCPGEGAHESAIHNDGGNGSHGSGNGHSVNKGAGSGSGSGHGGNGQTSVLNNSSGNGGSVSGSNHGSNLNLVHKFSQTKDPITAATAAGHNDGGSHGNSNGQSGVVNAGAGEDAGHDNNGSGRSGNNEAGLDKTSAQLAGPTGGLQSHDRTARREAALNKFRQKRKERNFEKKVRYLSRKKLAEQRPRVRGQFVRQGVSIPDDKK